MMKLLNLVAWLILAVVFTAGDVVLASEDGEGYVVGKPVHHSIVCLNKPKFDEINAVLKSGNADQAFSMISDRENECYHANMAGLPYWPSKVRTIDETYTVNGECVQVLGVNDASGNIGWAWAKCKG